MKTQTFLLESFNELSLVSNQQSQSIFRKDTNWKWTNFQTSPLHFRFNCALLFCYTNITIFISFLKIMTKLLPIFWWTFEPFWVELMIVLIRIFSWRRKCFYFRVCHTQKMQFEWDVTWEIKMGFSIYPFHGCFCNFSHEGLCFEK